MERGENDLNFEDGNPGAVKYGNFINYYQFNPPENRLKLFPNLDDENVWSKRGEENGKYFALDVGCNAGDLTKGVYKFLEEKKNTRMLGIDIDPVLIERATEGNELENLEYGCCNFMEQEERMKCFGNFFHGSFSLERKFHATFCFSITMWIHLNYGDDGLKQFLREICEISEDLIVIEPQPWSCYKSAIKRTKKNFLFPLYQELKVRKNVEDEIERWIISDGTFRKVFETPNTDWGRKLLFFRRNIL